jgi:hypothetical protein
MTSTACGFAIAFWQVVVLGIIMFGFGIAAMWLWFIKLGHGDWSENGEKEKRDISDNATN